MLTKATREAPSHWSAAVQRARDRVANPAHVDEASWPAHLSEASVVSS